MQRRTFATIAAGAFAAYGQDQKKKARPSPPAETSVEVNGKKIAIKYSAPSMRGRKIFGDLVPFGQVWRAGANEATAFHTDAALSIGNLSVPPGDYTLYVLPTANSWELIVNKQTGQWGTVYNAGNDLGRVKMALSKASAPVETYKMTLSKDGPGAKLQLEWENTVATISIAVR